MTTKPTVTKTSNGIFLVEGVIAVIRGKLVNNPFKRGFHLKRKAEAEAERIHKINVEALADLAETNKIRRAAVEVYLLGRAARKKDQSSFKF